MKTLMAVLLMTLGLSASAEARTEKATLAGGCFWSMQEILRGIPGVISTRVGFTGGQAKSPSHLQVKTGSTGHVEAVQLEFDPGKLKYETLLEWYFRMHDPTTLDRQGDDEGTHYRSVIFTHSDGQRRVAEQMIRRVDKSRAWKKPVVTKILPAGVFWSAEEHNQDYLRKHPGACTCHWVRDIKF